MKSLLFVHLPSRQLFFEIADRFFIDFFLSSHITLLSKNWQIIYFFRKLISAYFWAWRFPKEEHFVLFLEIFSIDFPQTSLKGEVPQYTWLPPHFSCLVNVHFLSYFPSWSQLIRLQDSEKFNWSKWIQTWMEKKSLKAGELVFFKIFVG